MAEKLRITENDKKQEEWYQEAKKQTLATLPEFLRHLTEDYGHDYGTICHAAAAAAMAAAHAVDASPAGGITGFQAGCIMWEFISEWNHLKGHALRLIDYDNLLYPQYEDKFTRHTIRKSTWDDIKAKAAKNLAESSEHAHPDVVAHWNRIVAGVVPFGIVVEAE